MKTIVFVTSNKGKAREAHRILEGFSVEVKNIDLPEAKHLTPEKLVELKAKDAFALVKRPVVVDDTGLFVKGFKDYPGLHSKDVLNEIGLKGFVKKCAGKKAYFSCLVGYCDGRKAQLFKGVCQGKISSEIARSRIPSLPYLSVFIPDGFDKPVSEFSKRELEEEWFEKNHRQKAFSKLKVFLGGN